MPKVFLAPDDPTAQPGGAWYGYDGISYPLNGLAFPSWQQTKFPSSFPDGTSQTIFFAEGYGQVAWPGSPGNYVWRSWWRYTSHRNWYDGSSDMWSPDYVANPNYNPPFQVLPPREQLDHDAERVLDLLADADAVDGLDVHEVPLVAAEAVGRVQDGLRVAVGRWVVRVGGHVLREVGALDRDLLAVQLR